MSQTPEGEHGSVQSYVIGFILSIVFTIIPYYLVVHGSLSGTAMLGTILGFAVVQMAIQLLFFLHLGRGPKPLYNIAFFASTAGIIVVVVAGSMFIMNHLYHNMSPAEVSHKLAEDEAIYQIGGQKTGACQGTKANHKVTIKDGRVSAPHTNAHRCDTLTFINEDPAARDITFGTHPHHDTYAGETDLSVRKGRGKTVTLSQPGTYQFHDHHDPDVAGSFTVSP